jgi:hypothetical protein
MKRLYPLTLLAAAVLAAGCSRNDETNPPRPPVVNTAPTIAAITDRSVDQDSIVAIDVAIADSQSDASTLTVSVAADGTTVFPADGVVLSGAGVTRRLTLTPLEATVGAARFTITVTDPQGLSTMSAFNVTLNTRAASVRDTTLATFAKMDADAPTALNGLTFAQDADDPAVFAALIPAESP